MRPKSIVYFERIIFATLILGIIQIYLGWNQTIAQAAETISNPIFFVLFIQLFTFLVIIILTLLVSRRRSKIAMWVSIALFALGLPMLYGIIASGQLSGSGAITALQTFGQLVAYGLLFTPSSRDWMNRKGLDDLAAVFEDRQP